MHPRRILAVIALVFFLSVPHFTFAQTQGAQTVESLLTQISQLTALIADLQAQIVALQGNSGNASDIGTSNIVASFSRNLTIGDRGEDVRALQQALNQNVKTRIAASGDGSPGYETTYFGPLTAAAVKKFQELYASEVLAPVGLSRGSGYVGPSTRKKLNNLFGQTVASVASGGTNTQDNGQNTGVSGQTTNTGSNTYGGTNTTSNTTSNTTNGQSGASFLPNISSSNATGLFISTASGAEGAPGETLTINGHGFSSTGNTVHFDTQTVPNISSIDGMTLVFTIPQSISKGAHIITVTDNTGKMADGTIDFVVKNTGATSPVIYTVSPALGAYGSQVTIYGSGFTEKTNRVLIGATVVDNVARVGNNKLVVTIAPTELADIAKGSSSDDVASEWPIYINVSNENGMTATPVVFVIRK